MTTVYYIVYKCDLMGLGDTPKNETPISTFPTFREAADGARILRQRDKSHSYAGGAA